jgi:hypothetical protein
MIHTIPTGVSPYTESPLRCVLFADLSLGIKGILVGGTSIIPSAGSGLEYLEVGANHLRLPDRNVVCRYSTVAKVWLCQYG